ncbi:hypothetical protein Tco_0277211 [Tanacetum coccineum]
MEVTRTPRISIFRCDLTCAIDHEVTRPGPLFRCDPIWGCYRLVSRAKVIENQELEGPMKDQPLSADASPTTLSPGYIADSDPKEDKEDPEEDPADHPADG